jgi:3',5'-cyclic AMP phosphodiesterase CpdA
MRVGYSSDWHLTKKLDIIYQEDVDVLVLAGDICEIGHIDLVEDMLKDVEEVIWVPGNHEYYCSNYDTVTDAISNSRFHYLNNKSIVIDGVKFTGTTLWFAPRYDVGVESKILNDYTYIKGFNPELWHRESVDFLSNEQLGDVVITHHCPSYELLTIHNIHTYAYSYMFYNNLNNLITSPVKHWVYGHTHQSMEYEMNGVKLHSNPIGYNARLIQVKVFEL